MCSYDEVTSLILFMGRNHMGYFLSIERKYVYIIGIIAFMAASYDKLSVSLAAIPPITFEYYVYICFPCM